MIDALEPKEQIDRVRCNDVMRDGEVMERSNALVDVFSGGKETVSGKDDTESVNWANAVVHIVNAITKSEKKTSGGRGSFRYRILGGRPWPPNSLRRVVMSNVRLLYPWSAL